MSRAGPSMRDPRRVAITGLGVVSAAGVGRDAWWDAAAARRRCIRPITRFDASENECRVAGEATAFSGDAFVDRRIIKQTDRSTHLGMAACHLAALDANLDLSAVDPTSVGLYFANVFGGMEFAEPELFAQAFLSPGRVSAYQSIAWFFAATQGQWSIARGINGYGKSIVGDRVGGLQALTLGALAIRQGYCETVFAGGFEAPLAPYIYAIHEATGRLARSEYRPFDRRSTGMVLAEGAAILVLESLEAARSRGAPIYAELAGGAMNIDDPDVKNALTSECIATALESAQVRAGDVAHVLPEGAGIAEWDACEMNALVEVFAARGYWPTLSIPKQLIGHALAAAGPIDAALAAMMLRRGRLLGGAPDEPLTEPLLPFLLEDAPLTNQAVVCIGRGWQGLNAALVMRKAAA